MARVPLCDQCRSTIDPQHPDALIAVFHRGVDADEWLDDDFVSGSAVDLRFCSQAHLAEFVTRNRLPAAPEPAPTTFGDVVATAVVLPLFLAVLAGSGYGFYLLVRELTG